MPKKPLLFSHTTNEKREAFTNIIESLKSAYKQKLLPLEESYLFQEFHSTHLSDADLNSKPMILLVGQYSTGKTTFIRYLLQDDYPDMHIGAEPTTDKFFVVMHSPVKRAIPGNTLVTDQQLPFTSLRGFGNNFLKRIQASMIPNPVLEKFTIIDTPGILSGERQSVYRGYDFAGVIRWFAERVDRIILLFDAHKLDISDEFKSAIEPLKAYDWKIRIVLNKADQVEPQHLIRVYGALMWSLSKLFYTPEVLRYYIGTFWNEPLLYDTLRRLFELQAQELFCDLDNLPRSSPSRKLNDLIKRAQLAKLHAYIISTLKKKMPLLGIGKNARKAALIRDLDKIYIMIQRKYRIPKQDFPSLSLMREKLEHLDFVQFHELRPRLIEGVDEMISRDLQNLMQLIPGEERKSEFVTLGEFGRASMGIGGGPPTPPTPFTFVSNEGLAAGSFDHEWIVTRFRAESDRKFQALGPVDGKISGLQAKEDMWKSRLPNNVLEKIWTLSDVDKDGMLDADEYALAWYLIKIKSEGNEIPTTLPSHLVPPSKRDRGRFQMGADRVTFAPSAPAATPGAFHTSPPTLLPPNKTEDG